MVSKLTISVINILAISKISATSNKYYVGVSHI